MYCTIDATKLTTDRHEASRDLFATADWAELLVWHTVGRWNSQAMVQLGWRIWGSTGETYKLLSRSNSRSNDCTKPRRIVTMTPNKLAVYFVADIFVADIVLADMVVADIDFPCGQYGFFLWPISSCCGRYGRTPPISTDSIDGLGIISREACHVSSIFHGSHSIVAASSRYSKCREVLLNSE